MLGVKLLVRATACVSMVAAAACTLPGSPQPQVLTFNYRVFNVADAGALAAALASGSTSLQAQLGPAPCNFTASFQRPRPDLRVSTVLGGQGFTVSIAGAGLTNLGTTNPPGCLQVRDLALALGSTSSTLTIGQIATATSGSLSFDDGSTLGNPVFFRATVNGYNPSTGRTHGNFGFVSNASYGATRIVVAEGSFAMN